MSKTTVMPKAATWLIEKVAYWVRHRGGRGHLESDVGMAWGFKHTGDSSAGSSEPNKEMPT